MKHGILWLGAAVLLAGGCRNSDSFFEEEGRGPWTVSILELSDQDYPDNPYLPHRHPDRGHLGYKSLTIEATGNPLYYNFILTPYKEASPQIALDSISVEQLIPTAPHRASQNPKLERLSLISLEWNRVQLQFREYSQTLESGGVTPNPITRVDLANSGLGAGRWEVQLFSPDSLGTERIIYHGWFSFPDTLYQQLVRLRNHWEQDMPFPDYFTTRPDETPQPVDLTPLGSLIDERSISVVSLDDTLPRVGEYQLKFDNIIYPLNPVRISDLQIDSARFASFVDPGIYRKNVPYVVETGRFNALPPHAFLRRKVAPTGETVSEIEIVIKDRRGQTTRILFGGLLLHRLPKLPVSRLPDAWGRAMGVGVPPFKQTYLNALANPSTRSTYYGLLLDEGNRVLDPSKIGVDGPMLHWDDKRPGVLHVWLLGFKRHAAVAHYELQIGSYGN